MDRQIFGMTDEALPAVVPRYTTRLLSGSFMLKIGSLIKALFNGSGYK